MEGTVKNFDKSKEANLSQVKKNEKTCLISEYDSHFKPDELVYDDFISRREFINRTGVYVSALSSFTSSMAVINSATASANSNTCFNSSNIKNLLGTHK